MSRKVGPIQVKPNRDNDGQFTVQDIYENELHKNRHNCTDVFCLLIFFLFGLIQVIMSVVLFVKVGNPLNILMPHDSNGNICSGSKSNLFYFNLVSCLNVNALIGVCPSPTVCISSCPSENLFYLIDSHRSILFNNYCDRNQLISYYQPNNVPSQVDSATYSILASNQICPLYALNSQAFYNRCLPSVIVSVVNGVTKGLTANDGNSTTYNITDTLNNPITDQTISQAASYVLNLLNIGNIAQNIVQDLMNGGVLIGVLLAIAAVTSFAYIVIMRWIIAPLVYGSLAAIIGGLVFVIYYCTTKYISLKNNPLPTSFTFSSDVSYYFSISYTWLTIVCIASFILLVLLLIIIAVIKRLRLAIQLIVEASKAVSDIFISVFFPIIPLILEIGFLVYFAATAIFLACNGTAVYQLANSTNTTTSVSNSTSSNNSSSTTLSCDLSSSISIQNNVMCLISKYGSTADKYLNQVLQFFAQHQYVPQVFNFFMFIWTEFFIIGLNQMILAGCFGMWYWSQSKARCSLLISIKDTFIYHLGSIAFGSLLIAIVQTVRFIINYIDKKVKGTAGNNSVSRAIVKFISCCCMCCFYCLEKFLKFINRNAYIMVAIYGRNFCRSAADAVQLIASNPLRALVLNGVTTFVLLLGSLLITVGMGVLGFYFFSKSFYIDPIFAKYLAPELHYYWVPLIVVVLGSFIIASTFLYVFEMAVDTVFLCAMKDLSVHDGSVYSPYFMSKKLLHLLSPKTAKKINSVGAAFD